MYLTFMCMKWVTGDASTIFFTTRFTLLNPGTLFSCRKTYYIIILPEADQTQEKFWVSFQFSLVPRGLIFGTKSKISCEFGQLQVKLWNRMFSWMKIEKCMESKLPGIFWVRLVAKYIVFGSLWTQRWAVPAAWWLFLKKHTNVVNQIVRV